MWPRRPLPPPSPKSPQKRQRGRNSRLARRSLRFSNAMEFSELSKGHGPALSPTLHGEFALQAPRQPRETRAKHEESRGHKNVSFRCQSKPVRVFQGLLERSQDVEQADDRDQGCVLEEVDGRVDDAWKRNP